MLFTPAGHLSGIVTEDGSPATPVVNAWIYLVSGSGSIQGVPAISNSDGEFVLADIPAGVYTLTLEHPDYLTQAYPGLQIQANITDYPATMTSGAVISGTVSDADGALEDVKIIANTLGSGIQGRLYRWCRRLSTGRPGRWSSLLAGSQQGRVHKTDCCCHGTRSRC